ncbi:hypothetical protein ACHQM5_029271 [Ranunculus cassubicifolius]
MAEEQSNTSNTNVNVEGSEVQDRGLFDFMGKKEKVEEKPEVTPITTEMENLKVSDEAEEKKPSLLEKLHRSDSNSSSSSSSEEEVEEDGQKIKRKKKKGLKEKIAEKVSGDKKEEASKVEAVEDTNVPIEKVEASHPEEKKTFMEKIKEKVSGGTHKSPVESAPVAVEAPAPAPVAAEVHGTDASPKEEKKGIFEKIKEKMPGYHKTEDEKKETTTDH